MKIDDIREALAPFAEFAGYFDDGRRPGEALCAISVSLDDLRKVRDAYADAYAPLGISPVSMVTKDTETLADGRWAGVPELVEQITSEEGATVTFTGSNPDFNGLPNEVVTVVQGPGWCEVAYRADTIADCLRQALERRAAESAP